MMLAIVFGAVPAAAFVLHWIGMRAPSLRTIVFELLARIKGIPVVWIDEPALAAVVLKASSIKGEFLERTFSTPAWAPVISMESVDDPDWADMKLHLVTLMKALPPTTQLEEIAHRVTQDYMAKHDRVDANGLVWISIATFYEWIFQRPFPTSCMFVCDATWEWRKQIAIKGQGDMALKLRTVEWIVDEVQNTSELHCLFGDAWREPACYSLLLQPFFISPAINISDIAVTIQKLYRPDIPLATTINLAIDTAHPFVLLERYLEHGVSDPLIEIAPGTHAFIPVDVMTTDSVIRFGAGPRKCPGAHVAMACMAGIFTRDLVGSPKFQPSVGHLYSGRDQDGQETMSETLYQVTQVLKACWQSFLQRIK
ncbi:unnamed protein product [Aphanomyces euteiches]